MTPHTTMFIYLLTFRILILFTILTKYRRRKNIFRRCLHSLINHFYRQSLGEKTWKKYCLFIKMFQTNDVYPSFITRTLQLFFNNIFKVDISFRMGTPLTITITITRKIGHNYIDKI